MPAHTRQHAIRWLGCARLVAAQTKCRRFSCSQLRVRHSSGQRQTCISVSCAILITCLSSSMLARTVVADRLRPDKCVSCEARRGHNAAQRIFIAAAWLCLQSQSGSLNSYPLRRTAARETRAELFRRRLPAGIARRSCDPFGRCLRKSLLPRTRDPSVLVLRMCHGSATSASAPHMTRDPPWKAEQQHVAMLAHAPGTPRSLTPYRRCRPAPVEVFF